MKKKLNYAAGNLLLLSLLFISCRKDAITTPAIDPNKLPIANAGIDQTFPFQPDSIMLDGSASYDPDGTIVSYQWFRISGPVSVNLINGTAKTTAVASAAKGRIEVGTYVFQLQVTDDKGASAKAMVTITVNRKTINVSSVDQLYKAVNDTTNAGALIIIAPGTYTLSSSYPNSGRLEVQTDMSLQGQKDHPEQVIVDESLLPAASFLTGTTRTGAIRIGSGTNILEWLTIKGGTLAANAFSAIDTDINSTETHIGIYHLTILGNGSSIGIDVRSRRIDQAGRVIDAVLEGNDISGVVTSLGPAIEIQNANNASGSQINVRLKQNYLHDNKVGMGAFNNASTTTITNSGINVSSNADRIEGNGIGIYLGGGLSQVATALGNDNTTVVDVHGSSIRNNNPVPLPPALQPVIAGVVPCGIYAYGGTSVTGGKASGNMLTIGLSDCDISGNQGTDIVAIGAHSVSGSPAGTNNVLKIQLDGISKNANVQAVQSFPAEPAGTNVVNVIR